MRYNENDGEEINGKIVISTKIDLTPVFEISCVVVGNIKCQIIKANYDLIILGDVEANKIEVAGNFICIGNCDCESVCVQGTCSIVGNLSSEEGFIGGTLTVKELCVDAMEIKGMVSCVNMECDDDVTCAGNVLIAEGLTGTGSLSSKMTVCGEYSLLDNTSGVFIADTLEMEEPTISNHQKETSTIDIEEWKMKAKRQSSQVFYGELARLADQKVEYKKECSSFKKLMIVENVVKIPSIKTYVEIMDILNHKYNFITDTRLYQKVKNCFESFTYDDVNHSKMTKISQRDFAKMFHVVTFRPQLFKENIRELILETLCMYVGMDLEIFQAESKELKNVEVIEQEGKEHRYFDLKEGDEISVVSGAWAGTEGKIISINETKETIIIDVELFGRTTPVEISISETKKK